MGNYRQNSHNYKYNYLYTIVIALLFVEFGGMFYKSIEP